MAPVLVTLDDLEGHSPVAGLPAFSSAIRRTFVQYFTRFQLTARSRGPSATAGFLVFISDVAWEDYLRKTACVWLCGYRHNPLSTTLPLSACGAEFFGLDLPSYRNSSVSCFSSYTSTGQFIGRRRAVINRFFMRGRLHDAIAGAIIGATAGAIARSIAPCKPRLQPLKISDVGNVKCANRSSLIVCLVLLLQNALNVYRQSYYIVN